MKAGILTIPSVALLTSVATVMLQAKAEAVNASGLVVLAGTVFWFLWVQTIWLAEHLGLARGRSALIAFRTFVKASIINGAVATVYFV